LSSVEVSEARGVRTLHFGSVWIQGAMRVARPWSLELEYTREMMLPLILHPSRNWPRTVLQIGLGAASFTRFLYRHRPRSRITVVEIVPEVVHVAREHFKLPDDPLRVAIEIGDGYRFLAISDRTFDLVLVDGFDAKGRAGPLDTIPFYANCRAHLSDAGAMTTNLLSRHRGIAASVGRIRAAFGERMLPLPPVESGNVAAVAAAGEPVDVTYDELRARARRLYADTGLDLLPTVARVEKARGGEGLTL
jgi:spermidine synthase